jgi:hypothetical protein
MSCDRAKDLMIDALVEPLDKEQLHELQEHIAGCESCAAEMAEYQALWQQLENVAIPQPRSDGLERLQAAVREEFGSEFGSSRPKKHPLFAGPLGFWQRVAAAIALIAIGAILSIGVDNYLRDTGPEVAVEDDRVRYLLIMTATQEGPELTAQAESEVQGWIAGLIEQGIMESGLGISDALPGATPPSGTLLNGPVSGFIVIRAADIQEARRIVLASPVIDYGGLIEIRAIDGNGSDQ